MARASRARVTPWAVVALLLLLVLVPQGSRAAYPTLPLALDGRFVTNLSAPVLAPGTSGTIAFDLADPWTWDLATTTVSVEVYAFNGFPGNATGLPSPGAVTLGPTAPTAPSVRVVIGTIVPGAAVPVRIDVAASSSAPDGAYAVRISIIFSANGSSYWLASRGEFTSAEWIAATQGPSGTSMLNLTTLGVSGIVPETAVQVRSTPFPIVLTIVLVSALLLAGAGGYYAFRSGPGTRSGATTADVRSHAPTAFGKRRKRDGD